jgi:cytochrome P450
VSSVSKQPGLGLAGSNGIAIVKHSYADAGYRTYEVYQRERVGESTEKINGADLVSAAFAADPYPGLTILREHYPCYRDWVNNCYWLTRYDDVTSILADDANFESRSKRWLYGLPAFGRDLNDELPVLEAWASGLTESTVNIAEEICSNLPAAGANFATEFAAQFAAQMLAKVVGVPHQDVDRFASLHWRLQRGAGWLPSAQQAGLQALAELVLYFQELMAKTSPSASDQTLLATVQRLGGDAKDLVVTILEADLQTLHGGLANLWSLLLTHPSEFAKVQAEPRLLKVAYLETMRHSTPIVAAQRFAKHEVERFGRLLPAGSLVVCAAAAANRDPRVFAAPEEFIANRRDICHREARGQYRADGLATGITLGLGAPTKHPAVPEDRPISRYALVRDSAVSASTVVMDQLKNLRLQPDIQPLSKSLAVGEMYCCWSLPVLFER